MKNRLNTEIEIKDYDKYREIPKWNKDLQCIYKKLEILLFRKSWRNPHYMSKLKLYQF